MKLLPYLLVLAGLTSQAAFTQANDYRYFYTLTTTTGNGWTKVEPLYDAWESSGEVYGCSNWSPSTSSIGKGISFVQKADDCKQQQTRVVHPQRRNDKTGEVESIPNADYTESKTIAVSQTRDEIGVLENWLSIAPTYTNWMDTNALYGCTEWSPAPSIFTTTNTFTQTSSTCKTDQVRQRQDREQERFTEEIRSSGEPVTEQQTLTNQNASRPYSVTLGDWTAVGEPYACSNWSPAASTIGKGTTFTQSATDCKLNQTRARSESFKDHKTGQIEQVSTPNENRTLTNQASTQVSTGTMEQWVATTPTYTAWTNTSALYGCSVWTPAPSSKTTTGTFTQTASDCETDQTRNRQDREQESTTMAFRNKGTPVAETQTLTAQTATRSYTVTLGAWADSGSRYNCTNWSPSTDTIAIGEAFTQNATDCKQDQSRSRNESYVDHLTTKLVSIAPTTEAQTLSALADTRSATGTVAAPTASLSAPSAVFINTPLSLTWSGTNVTSYALRGSAADSGLTTTNQAVTGSSTTATPSAAGTYTYTLTAKNSIGVSTTSEKSVVAEGAPSIGGLTVNGVGAVNVSPSAALTFAGSSLSAGAVLQGRNAANSTVATLPALAASVAGTTTYYATATKTLNGVTNIGSLKSVAVTVIDNPVISTISASATPFTGQAFTLNWSGTGVTSYVISSNSNASGISTAGVSMGTTTAKAITPTAAGTYVYTITAQNSLGVTTTASKTLVVDDPSAHGVVALTSPTGQNVAVQMPNDVTYRGTIDQMQKGVATELSLLIGNYANNANGVIYLSVCSTSGGCTTGTANVVGSVDNVNILFVFAKAITIAKGDTLSYAFALSGSNYGPAIWTYSGNAFGTASYISGTSRFPYLVIRYQ